MDLSTLDQQVLLQADDHTDYFASEWLSDSELAYIKHDYDKDSDQELRITVPSP